MLAQIDTWVLARAVQHFLWWIDKSWLYKLVAQLFDFPHHDRQSVLKLQRQEFIMVSDSEITRFGPSRYLLLEHEYFALVLGQLWFVLISFSQHVNPLIVNKMCL